MKKEEEERDLERIQKVKKRRAQRERSTERKIRLIRDAVETQKRQAFYAGRQQADNPVINLCSSASSTPVYEPTPLSFNELPVQYWAQ